MSAPTQEHLRRVAIIITVIHLLYIQSIMVTMLCRIMSHQFSRTQKGHLAR